VQEHTQIRRRFAMTKRNGRYLLISVVLIGVVFSQSIGAQNILFSGWKDLDPGSSLDDMENFVEGLGYTVTRSDSFPEDLAGYDILVLMGGGVDSEDIPDAAVDEFVHVGNGLILFEGIVEAGDFNTSANSNPVESYVGWDWRADVTVVDPDHFVCTGVSQTCAFTGYSTNPVFKPGGHILIEWDDQAAFAATYSFGSGLIVYFNDLQAWYYDFWGGDLANGQTLLENSLAWVSPVGTGEERPAGLPESGYVLYQNIPNPFCESTGISYSLSNNTSVRLQILDIQGRTVRVLERDTALSAGLHITRWDGRDARGHLASSGVYFYQLRADGVVQQERMILSR
jgi:hypothetical protein